MSGVDQVIVFCIHTYVHMLDSIYVGISQEDFPLLSSD